MTSVTFFQKELNQENLKINKMSSYVRPVMYTKLEMAVTLLFKLCIYRIIYFIYCINFFNRDQC